MSARARAAYWWVRALHTMGAHATAERLETKAQWRHGMHWCVNERTGAKVKAHGPASRCTNNTCKLLRQLADD